jgi:sugar lactone lactonase YvrE
LPYDVALGPDGSFYIADFNDVRVRKVDPDGIVTTLAGTGTGGTNGDGGPATQAKLVYPNGVAVGRDGGIYFADTNHHRIRKVFTALPGFDFNDIPTPDENGSKVYIFNSAGKHLSTIDSLTGAPTPVH